MKTITETLVVLIPCHHVDARHTCEMIQGHKITLSNINDVPMYEIEVIRESRNELTNITPPDSLLYASIYTMDEYMDRFNNEELEIGDYFMSYIHVTYTLNSDTKPESPENTAGALVRKFSEYDPNEVLCVVVWNKHDVIGIANDLKIQLTDEQVNHVLKELHRLHDSTYGITWDTVRDYVIDELEGTN